MAVLAQGAVWAQDLIKASGLALLVVVAAMIVGHFCVLADLALGSNRVACIGIPLLVGFIALVVVAAVVGTAAGVKVGIGFTVVTFVAIAVNEGKEERDRRNSDQYLGPTPTSQP